MSVFEPSRSRWQRRLITALVVASLAILLGVVGGTVLVRGGAGPGDPADSPSPSPTGPPNPADTVRAFLEAVAAADAEAALAEAATQPADLSMLTDEALTAALAEAPISEINVPPVNDVEPEDETTSVRVSYLIGEERVNDSFDVTRTGQRWKVTETTTEIDLSSIRAKEIPLLVNGSKINSNTITVLPGQYEITSGLDYIDYGEENTLLVAAPSSGSGSTSSIKPTLTSAGTRAFTDEVESHLEACMAKKELAPKGCPFGYKLGYREKITAKTIKWVVAGDPDLDPDLDYTDQHIAKANFQLQMKLTATGSKNGEKSKFSETVSSYPTVTADMTGSSVRITWS